MGKRKQSSSLFKRVRLKRHRSRGTQAIGYYEVQKKAGRTWVSLGSFNQENDALDILEDEVELMTIIEFVRGLLD